MRRPAAWIFVVLVAGCTARTQVPAETAITCKSGDDCPEGWVCLRAVERCARPDSDDEVLPQLVDAVLTPDRGAAGTAFSLEVVVDEELLLPPRVREVAGDASLEWTLDAGASRPSLSRWVFVHLAGSEPEGVASLEITMVDVSGNTATAPGPTLSLDYTGPVVADLAWDPPSLTGSTSPGARLGFRATADASALLLGARLIDPAGKTVGSVPVTATPVEEGPAPYVRLEGYADLAFFSVESVDAVAVALDLADDLGNLPVAGTAETTYLTIDATDPETVIESAPSPSGLVRQVAFDFSSTSGDAVFECSLDGGAFTPCASPAQYFVDIGEHLFVVRAIDGAGNVDESPASHAFVVERRWAQLSASTQHTCAIASDGTLWCWGGNLYGQLGLGTSGDADESAPRQVGEATDWLSVRTGSNNTCAIRDAGGARRLHCWGQLEGGLGGEGGGATLWDSPVEVEGSGWLDAAPDGTLTCGIRDEGGARSLWCFGTGYAGDGYASEIPPTRVGTAGDWLAVSRGGVRTCGIRDEDGQRTLWCWGQSNDGALGTGTSIEPSPAAVAGAGWTSLATGPQHTCAVKIDGEARGLWCWGSNAYGQAGQPPGPNVTTPTLIAGPWVFDSVLAGAAGTCARQVGGEVLCWGKNQRGELGARTGAPVAASSLGGAVAFAVGGAHTCLLAEDGTLACRGDNAYGQLGIGVPGSTRVPAQVGMDIDWSGVSAGVFHTCARRGAALYCWGEGLSQQIGVGLDSTTPVPVGVGGTWTSLAAGGSHTCALQSDDSLWCWGSDSDGQLGDGTAGGTRGTPEEVLVGGAWSSLCVSGNRTCGVREGVITCFGVATPSQPATSGWVSVTCGGAHNCGIRDDGALWCWGGGGVLGTSAPGTGPVQVGPPTGWQSVDAGDLHTCGIHGAAGSGELFCWGAGSSGQLGYGLFQTSNTAIQVGGDADWTSISAGGSHTCGTKSDGSLWCWGSNSAGQLGGSDHFKRASPLRVTESAWTSVSAGGNHTCAVRQDGALMCWGANSNGGTGALAFSAAPVEVAAP